MSVRSIQRWPTGTDRVIPADVRIVLASHPHQRMEDGVESLRLLTQMHAQSGLDCIILLRGLTAFEPTGVSVDKPMREAQRLFGVLLTAMPDPEQGQSQALTALRSVESAFAAHQIATSWVRGSSPLLKDCLPSEGFRPNLWESNIISWLEEVLMETSGTA